MLKRSLFNPYIYVMAVILLALSIVSIIIPDNKASAYIPVALLNLDESEETITVVDNLCDKNSVFTFYEVDSEEELYEDIASGKANTGYIIPEDFMDNCLTIRRAPKISMVVTPSSTLTSVSSEQVFNGLFRYIGFYILEDIASGENPDSLRAIYNYYMASDDIFHLQSVENREYSDITTTNKIIIPVYKFAGFFIFMASLIGALAFLHDSDNKLYLRMSFIEKTMMGLILIGVYTLPVTIVSMVAFLIAGISFSVLKLLVFNIVNIVFALIIGAIFTVIPGQGKKSRIFAAILPAYLLLSFIFGGVLFDLAPISPLIKAISLLFIPHYF
ncbi:MAG: ABC transporter permease [Saccharofermentans sp.]|nr:ABC transporter permease [Saccharofermentans sp.]